MPLDDRESVAPLWFRDGARYARVEVRATRDGALEILSHEMGAGDRAVWGEDDHEVTLRLEPRDLAKLASALLTERCGGRADALEAVRAICEEHDVPVKVSVWT
jgi:hypothetical protein